MLPSFSAVDNCQLLSVCYNVGNVAWELLPSTLLSLYNNNDNNSHVAQSFAGDKVCHQVWRFAGTSQQPKHTNGDGDGFAADPIGKPLKTLC